MAGGNLRRIFDVNVARCRFPLASLLPHLVTGLEGGALAAPVALRLPRRRAYSALACLTTSLATARLSVSPRMRGLLQARSAISDVNPC